MLLFFSRQNPAKTLHKASPGCDMFDYQEELSMKNRQTWKDFESYIPPDNTLGLVLFNKGWFRKAHEQHSGTNCSKAELLLPRPQKSNKSRH